ncbi:MAG: DUF1294 domain-containing protein [Clostridia bacterium]|nr:DUF1294 domain-containing protein [Clostridia bacterium]
MLFCYLLTVVLALSALAFCLYGMDKHRAKRGRWRIPERWLLAVGFCGGAVGSLLGMTVFRHKTKKWYFTAVNLLGLLWQGVLLWLVWGVGSPV